MRIDQDHLYHGSAILQICEDPHFKAINSMTLARGPSRNAFEVMKQSRGRAAVYLKYASEPTPAHNEYVFNFSRSQLAELQEVAGIVQKVYLALVCVAAKEICCLPYEGLLTLIAERRRQNGAEENTYTLLVTCEAGKSFRVYMNVPGVRNTMFGEIVVPRNRFPAVVFE